MNDTDQYDRCSICDQPLPDTLGEYARQTHTRRECSPGCAQRRKVQQMGCCEKATLRPCVCSVAFDCPDHGESHHGTHE